MFTTSAAMLVLLGFLVATLLTFLVAPAYRSRIARLTELGLRRSMPMTEAEIRADKDRLRADYAIKLHKQALTLDELRSATARHVIEINRRDARITALEGDLDGIKSRLEESENARRVLEQTIKDRLPRVEHRLAEAKKLLFQRDRDIATLTGDYERVQRALNEATQINAQQRTEISRYQAISVNRGATSRESLADPRFDAEVALRSEIEGLREQTRTQTSLIDRLQQALSGTGPTVDAATPAAAADSAPAEVAELKRQLLEAEAALKAAKPAADVVDTRAMKAQLEDQAAEVGRLKAALEAYEGGADESRTLSMKDSRIAMKSRLSALQAQVESQTETIQRLRAETAAANERLARQAQHFMEEMRRLGAGTLPASAPQRRRPEAQARRSLAERISQVNPALADALSGSSRAANDTTEPPARALSAEANGSSSETPKPRGIAAQVRALAAAEPAPAAEAAAVAPSAAEPAAAAAGTADAAASPAEPGRRRMRLLDRIADLSKTS